jgi:MFS transporter, DHA3 family, macrolide efflux protein
VQQNLRPYIVVLIGQLCSLLGSQMTSFGLAIWVYQKYGSVTSLALVSVAAMLPVVLLGPVVGIYLDRLNRKKLLLAGNIGPAFSILAMAILFWLDRLEVWHIVVLAVLSSSFAAVLQPGFAASTTMMVPVAQLSRANGMRSLGFGIVTLLYPALAGALLGLIELKGVFIVDLISFAVGIISLACVEIPQPKKRADSEHASGRFFAEMQLALRYLRENYSLLLLMFFYALVVFIISTMQVCFTPLVLSFTDASTLGVILSVGGCGVILGGIVTLRWNGPERKILATFATGFAIAIVSIFAPILPNPITMAIGAFIIMALFPIVNTSSMYIWQRKVPPDLQGRVFGISAFLVGGMTPLAYLIAGPLADQVFKPLLKEGGSLVDLLGPYYGVGEGRGVALMMSCFGFLCLFILLLGWLNPRIRHIDTELPDYEAVTDII